MKYARPTIPLAIALCIVLGYQALGQRALSPDAAVIAVVRIDALFDELQQRADARIELHRMESAAEDELRRRTEAITQLEGEIENVVAAAHRKTLIDQVTIQQLQLRFWQQETSMEIEVEKAMLLQNLYRSLREAIAALAAAEGYDLVLLDDSSDDLPFDREQQVSPQVQVLQQIATRKLLYRNPALDITHDLATRMNNQYRTISSGGQSP